jgi:hypothetical protein
LGGGFGTSKINSSFPVSKNFCRSLTNSWKVSKRKSNNPFTMSWSFLDKMKHENTSVNYNISQSCTMLIISILEPSIYFIS